MDEQITKILQDKAREVRDLLAEHQIICTTYTVINYGINFPLQHNGKRVNLNLSYSSNKNRWTAQSADSWIKTIVIPLLTPLLSPSQESKLVSKQIREHTSSASYFETAKYCLTMLEPFQDDNIDCSIIIEQAQRDIQFLLQDVQYGRLNRNILQELLAHPVTVDFQSAKEFLSQCLNTITN
ncbi:hypothetical protein [Ktedonospora formicarum]|uniref:Uncharacterized protein n=1 Tax=Ktedonospora formicarum TaxID=2778364 RepID=A0A8J3I8Z1_9CHLR|nr:hypothetical protein [Ktedonospora formicarum]GHO49636.1 hypothetical protein KSX_77990 [Ktedonospora formicarum]